MAAYRGRTVCPAEPQYGPTNAGTDPSGSTAQFWKTLLPADSYRPSRQPLGPMLHQQPPIYQPTQMIHPTLFQHNLVDGGPIVVIIKSKLSPATPRQLQRQRHHSMLGPTQLVQRADDHVGSDLGIAKGAPL